MTLSADFTRSFPDGMAIRAAFDLDLDTFGITVLFGPSGCGKTTVLRCLAGLDTPESGFIRAREEVWCEGGHCRVPAWDRRVGYVFQEAGLFPHLSVAHNIAFGLHGWPTREKRPRVGELIQLMGLEGLAHRRPFQLSGGQRQRVALARALAPRQRLVLLDEPFASLDREAADQLRHNLREILQKMGVPTVLVTHSPTEALALGDRMLKMSEGRIVQEGPPAEVLSANGSGGDEPLGVVVRTRVLGRTEGLLRLEAGPVQLFAPDPGGDFRKAYACLRREGVSLERGPHGQLTQRNQFPARITAIQPLGALAKVQLDAGFPLEALITAWAREDLRLEPGQTVQALVKASAIRVIPIQDTDDLSQDGSRKESGHVA